jgi:serine/threonine-protein kinase
VRTIGHYELRRELSRGTTPLFEVFDTVLGRSAIIRALARSLAIDPDRRTRFLDAAIVAARLSHPNIAPVLDIGDHYGEPFVVLEKPEGQSLRSLMESGTQISIEVIISILSQICMALLHAQEHGVMQLGLRPTGIFVTASAQVSIVPFGTIPIFGSGGTIAALSRDEIAYLAPEVVENRMPDRRADIFSIGVIAYELLAGRRPFQATSIPALLHALLHEEPDRSAIPASRYSPEIERVVCTALARDPGQRFTDVAIMLLDLETLAIEMPDATAALPLAPPQPTETEAHALRTEAMALASEGRFREALALLARIEACAPDDPRNALLRDYLCEEEAEFVLLAMVENLMRHGQLREARVTAGDLLVHHPSSTRARELVSQLDRMLFALQGRNAPALRTGAVN